MKRDKRIGYELPGHPDKCDCPICEEAMLASVILSHQKRFRNNRQKRDAGTKTRSLRKPA
jgi:hypothetical protein